MIPSPSEFDKDPSDERPDPPELVYKYVVADRLDVLRNGNIRFTPPLNTNDIFEVRQTFDLLAGPKMKALFEEQMAVLDIDGVLVDSLKDTPLNGMSVSEFKKFFGAATGGLDLEAALMGQLEQVLHGVVFPTMNSPGTADDLLNKLGSDLICLSLTERYDSSPMWAHYAGNSSGFVIAFDTSNGFFKRGDEAERQGLHKITYFDGKISEAMDDPYAAFMSKQADWAYEREWRLYVKAAEANKTFVVGSDTIHLVDFPGEAVQRVILGVRATTDLENEVRLVLEEKYPHALLSRVRADRTTAALIEEPVALTDLSS